MPIRICQLITELRLSGAERVVYELSRRLDRRRFEVCVAALRGGQVEQMLQAAGIPVYVLDVRGKWDVGKIAKLSRLLREQRIDLLHTHLFHADLVGRPAAMRAGVKHLVHTVHVAERRFRPWQYLWARMMDFACDRLICVSQSVLDHHSARSRLPQSRYVVIPNGVDVDAFSRDHAARERTRRQWGLDDSQIVVLFVGRLDHQKGIDTLIAAMRCVLKPDTGYRIPDTVTAKNNGLTVSCPTVSGIRFVIAGDGPQRAMVERYLADNKAAANCLYVGFVSDVRAALSAADIFVLPSRWEGWPLALAEAMAAGLPCVGTDVPGIRDIIEPWRTGLLVPPENPTALAGAIRVLADDPAQRESLAAAGLNDIRENYSIQKNVAAHEELYERIVGLK